LEKNINFDDIIKFYNFDNNIEIEDNDRFIITPNNVNNVYFL